MAIIYTFPSSNTMRVYYYALRGQKTESKKAYGLFRAEEIEKNADWFFPIGNIIFTKTIDEFKKKKEKAIKYPGHLPDHHERVFYNSIILSNINKQQIKERDVKNTAKLAYAALIHDIFKGEVDDEGRDIHGKLASEFAEDVIYGFPIDEDIKKETVSIIRTHGDYEMKANTLDRIMERFYRLSGRDMELRKNFMLADTLDRINEDRIFLKLYEAIRAGKYVNDVAKSRWFFFHKENDDIFDDVEYDKRPDVLRIFDDDVRATIKKFNRKLYAGVIEEEIAHRKRKVIEKNENYNASWHGLKNGYNDYLYEMSFYFKD